MKRALVLAMILGLAACKQDLAQDTTPVELTAETLGHFCQMNLLEHPGPKAQIHLEGMPGTPLFFSQVRDAIAYARLPEQSHPILAMQVNDMGAPGATWEDPGRGNWIDADDAFFVLGSAREGGMGAPEAVPFGTEGPARAFAAQEGGTVMRLSQIPDDLVLTPRDAAPDPAEDADFENRLRALSRPEG
ncbi:nitrous oxide reductase accessory protein NosL [Paracoccus benzoatiresistens]|uniref:Nitrous oxide reductase accessory protein NosL n=1 Tax=Paracoccus benzoatiresistens TaxID=2997341 RepID=A0ABT4J7L6_9RHOB|nr:nitrous oxide reductase accessory protein NosL [Paracoccus sp. EF6]MCZ0963123.1 nitrous oxide reductase accessory protein NosL [Paracoccus sp. EF6]